MSINRCAKLVLFFMVLILADFDVSVALSKEEQDYRMDYRQLALFRRVMESIRKDYVREVEDKELIAGAVKGMLQALDPHSSYLPEDVFKQFRADYQGEFGGLGIEINIENGVLTIINPMEGTPAFKAGLRAGDKITRIGGKSTRTMSLKEAVNRMRGPRGSKITISVVRNRKEPVDYTIVREIIQIHSVKSHLLEKGYAYIRLVTFQLNTAKDLSRAINKLVAEGSVRGLILDLRNNPGGLLDQAVKVSNLFLDNGLIVYTDGRNNEQRAEFRATRSGEHYGFKLAVLINQGSASASEIVAGCLQDHQRSLLFGTNSFGKASVQTIVPLEDGGALRLTTAYYYTPRGRHIQTKGIQPDVDLAKDLEKHRDKDLPNEDPDTGDKKKKQAWRSGKVDPATDLAVAKALAWLKSEQTVEEYRIEREAKIQDTAMHMK
jgi:carboxyl-terminal processing protease